jgi:flavorubredoxin
MPLKNNVLIVYETMWKSTEKMAHAILEGLSAAGISGKLYDINSADRTDIVKELLDSRGLIVGSSTHDNNMLPTIAGFLDFIKGLKLKGRIGASFGSSGWSGEAVKLIENSLAESGVNCVMPGLPVKYVPSGDDLEKCSVFGKGFADKVKAAG